MVKRNMGMLTAAVTAALAWAFVVASSLVAGSIPATIGDESAKRIVATIAMDIILISVWAMLRDKDTDAGKRPVVSADIVKCFVWTIAIWAGSWLTAFWFSNVVNDQMTAAYSSAHAAMENSYPIARIAVTCLIAPIAEELFFRDLVAGSLEMDVGRPAAAILSSLAFAGAHLTMAHLAFATVSGLFYYIISRRHGIVTAICAHSIMNVASLLLDTRAGALLSALGWYPVGIILLAIEAAILVKAIAEDEKKTAMLISQESSEEAGSGAQGE